MTDLTILLNNLADAQKDRGCDVPISELDATMRIVSNNPDMFDERFFAYAPTVLVNDNGVVSDINPESPDSTVVMVKRYKLTMVLDGEIFSDMKPIFNLNVNEELLNIACFEFEAEIKKELSKLDTNQVVCWHTVFKLWETKKNDNYKMYEFVTRYGIYTKQK